MIETSKLIKYLNERLDIAKEYRAYLFVELELMEIIAKVKSGELS